VASSGSGSLCRCPDPTVTGFITESEYRDRIDSDVALQHAVLSDDSPIPDHILNTRQPGDGTTGHWTAVQRCRLLHLQRCRLEDLAREVARLVAEATHREAENSVLRGSVSRLSEELNAQRYAASRNWQVLLEGRRHRRIQNGSAYVRAREEFQVLDQSRVDGGFRDLPRTRQLATESDSDSQEPPAKRRRR
jgi:hypothetical protein